MRRGVVVKVAFRLNGDPVEIEARPGETLLTVLRRELDVLSVRETCGIGVCGACTVLVGGEPISSCLLLAPLADGVEITTAEGLGEGDHPVQAAFAAAHAFQCGFCTPGNGSHRCCPARREPEPDRRRDQAGAGRQPLPLRLLREDPRRRSSGGILTPWRSSSISLHLGREHVIGSYLLGGDVPAIVDCGPSVCADALEAGLADRGLRLAELEAVLLTHIHPDHAGGAGTLVRRNPRLQVHVSEIGAPHLVDPSRLERSARRLYGDEFDRLFGEIVPVPADQRPCLRRCGRRHGGLPDPRPRLPPCVVPGRAGRLLRRVTPSAV